jgi:hypothetical protein
MASTEKKMKRNVVVTLPAALIIGFCLLVGFCQVGVDGKTITFHPSLSNNNNHRAPREVVMPVSDHALFSHDIQDLSPVTRIRRMDSTTSFTLTQGGTMKDSIPPLPTNSTSAVSIPFVYCMMVPLIMLVSYLN